MLPISKSSSGNWLSPVIAGLVYAMLVAGTATVICSLILAITDLKEESMPVYVFIIHGLAVFTGGFITAKRSGVKGWYRGGYLGICYGLIISIVSYLGFHVDPAWRTLLFLLTCFIIGAFGGMLGVNARR
jgi:putative membrane protein (TIGR04086 family)